MTYDRPYDPHELDGKGFGILSLSRIRETIYGTHNIYEAKYYDVLDKQQENIEIGTEEGFNAGVDAAISAMRKELTVVDGVDMETLIDAVRECAALEK